MIRLCTARDFEDIWKIINDGAQAYRGVIPTDRWAEPYMSEAKLQAELTAGVTFWGYEDADGVIAVMGIQQVEDVTLIRHAYVRGASQKRGLGGRLLVHLLATAVSPVLVGTWASATWAIDFYRRHGFTMVDSEEKDRLLRRYWTVPERQIETSVVLADRIWQERRQTVSC